MTYLPSAVRPMTLRLSRRGWQHRPRIRRHDNTLFAGAPKSVAKSLRVHGSGRFATALTSCHTFPFPRVQRLFRLTIFARKGSPLDVPSSGIDEVPPALSGETSKTCPHIG